MKRTAGLLAVVLASACTDAVPTGTDRIVRVDASPAALHNGLGHAIVLTSPGLSAEQRVGYALFGPQVINEDSWSLSGTAVQAFDAADPAGNTATDACTAIINPDAVAGNIALVTRGICTFSVKVKNAQIAGAIGVIVVDNVVGDDVLNLGGFDESITIPSFRIPLTPGTALRNAAPVEVTLTLVELPDEEHPVLTVPASTTIDATSPSGAAFSFTPSATDNVGVESLVCSPASGSVFPVGTTTVTCVASDAAGHEATASFDVSVNGPTTQIDDLEEDVGDLDLAEGTETSIQSKLSAATAGLASGDKVAACGSLNALLNQISAQSGKKISAEDASKLIANVERIRSASGC